MSADRNKKGLDNRRVQTRKRREEVGRGREVANGLAKKMGKKRGRPTKRFCGRYGKKRTSGKNWIYP